MTMKRKIMMKNLHKGVNLKNGVISLIAGLVLLNGCSKPPEPVVLDGTEAVTINQELIAEHSKSVPKDPFLKQVDWTYNMYFHKQGDRFIADDDVVKAFYLAHNADRMIIIGNSDITGQYKEYFLRNGVEADIELHPIYMVNHSKETVNVLFFHKKTKG